MRHLLAQCSIAVVFGAAVVSACDDLAGPSDITGTYELVSENGDPIPSDPSGPDGCCLTLSGTLELTTTAYELETHHRNKNSQVEFSNAEHGTWLRDGLTVTFTRIGGSGEGFPYLLAPAQLSEDGKRITLRYGDEGPGSDQIVAIYQRP